MATSGKVTDFEEDFGDRAWLAYLALERDEHGRPPAQTPLEEQQRIARGTLGKIFSGQRREVEWETARKLAVVLRTTPEYLAHGTGPRPVPREPVLPRPRRFGPDGKPIRLRGVYEGVLPESTERHDRAIFTTADELYLRSPEGRALITGLPEEVRRAVLGAVHLLGCSLESAGQAAVRAMARHQGSDLNAEMWFSAIRSELNDPPPTTERGVLVPFSRPRA